MTAAAIEQCVSIAQGKIGALVIELLGNEFDDVGVTALMLTVACPALQAFPADQPAVKSFAAAQVLSNLLVAAGAQLPLAAAIATIMTVGTLHLEVRMGSRHLAWHEQDFDLCSTERRTEGEHHHEQR